MKLLRKIRSLGRKGKLVLAIAVLGLGVAAALPAVQAEFAPVRPVYDYNKFDPNNLDCDDPNNPAAQNGRCGSMNGPVFDSFINTPSYGDERSFMDGRRTDQSGLNNQDNITNVTDGSKEVILRIEVHNNANQDTNDDGDPNTAANQFDGKGVAHNARVRILLPTGTEQVLRARGYISADNASLVEDTVDMTSPEKFNISYMPGSAKLLRNNISYALSDSIVGSEGALIGNTVMDGNLPGCFDYAALVEVHVKITPKPTPNLQVTKEVKIKGDASWSKAVSAKPNATVEWRLGTKDISNANLDNVVMRDILPPHVKLVPGSIHLISPTDNTVLADGPLVSTGGYNVGNYVPGSIQYIIFDTTAKDDFDGCSVKVSNIVRAHSDQTPTEVTDTADVTITKENCNQTTPAYACNSLTVLQSDNRTATFTTNASATGGAVVTLYQYNFGDNTPVFSTTNATVSHTYAQNGQYAARVIVQVTLPGNVVKYVDSDKCAAPVNFTSTTPPTTTTTSAPTKLVNTGAGDVIELFAATVVVSSVAYRIFAARRLSDQ